MSNPIYNEINREGFETEVGYKLSDEEWNGLIHQIEKFIENAQPEQHEVDDFVVDLAYALKEQPVSNDTTTLEEKNYIGASVLIKYEDGETIEGYISFEEFPEDAPEDDYILPLAGIRDDEVMLYMEYPEFLKLIKTAKGEDFVIESYQLVSPKCS